MSRPFARRRIRVRVPATTSNLGPGFDVLGLALRLYNEVELDALPEPGALEMDISGEGADTLPRDGTNVVVRAVRAGVRGRRLAFGLRLKLTNRIPLARGLGSSAAARLGGLLAVRALLGGRRAAQDGSVLDAAVRLEGHPDNVVPALHGGLCVCARDGNRTEFLRLGDPKGLVAAVCIPDFELPTAKARAVLPKTVPLQDAVATSGRAALLVCALQQGRYDLLRTAMQDVLHQPYRRRLVLGMDRVIAAALRAGAWGAALSGAGPSILALAPVSRRAAAVGGAMQRAFAGARVKSRFLVLEIASRGAEVSVLA